MYIHKEKNSFVSRLKPFIISTLIGIIVILLVFVLLSLIYLSTDLPDSNLALPSIIAVAIGSMAAGFVSVRILGSKGLVCGIVSGLILFLVLLSIGLALSSSPTIKSLLKLSVSLLSGGIGGIIGVNFGRRFS